MTADDLRTRLAQATILPILTVHNIDATLRTVEALVDGGVTAVEIVLRTPLAADAIRATRAHFPDLLLGAGTVVSPASFDTAVATGADLAISPGLPSALLAHHRGRSVPLVPGVLSPTEVLSAVDAGYRLMKYYPAVASNGSVVLDDYANLFPDVAFIPTGKIGFDTLPAFARLKNVVCIGGSWMHGGSMQEVQEKVRRSFAIVNSAREG